MGAYAFTPDIFDAIEDTPLGKNGEVLLTDALRVIGKTSGRHIFVVLKPSTAWPGWHEVVTARPAKKWEKQLFARRRKGSV